MGTHGADVVESLVPILVWVLEGLASSRAQLREKGEEAERERGDREELMERYQLEKTLRKENQAVRGVEGRGGCVEVWRGEGRGGGGGGEGG